MVNLKKYNVLSAYFVLFLTFGISSCTTQKIHVRSVEGRQIGITKSSDQKLAIDNFIAPYRKHIDADLSTVLAYCPETLDKFTGQWQTGIGSMMADVTRDRASIVMLKRYSLPVDVCLLNHGGIRAAIPKGDVTTRTAFEVMPFENEVVVIQLTGAELLEIANYIIKEKKPHPLSGMSFTIDKNNNASFIAVNGKPLQPTGVYYVATSDYLANGGDNMNFFRNGSRFDLDYKLRNVLIDHFRDIDTLRAPTNLRIIQN